jgi:hypothetical protein
MIEFNLACYASVTGRFEEAKAQLKRAIELEKEIRRLPLDDEDLKSFWDWIAPASATSKFGPFRAYWCLPKRKRGTLVTF